MEKQLGLLTVHLVATSRSVKAHIRYEGDLPFDDVELDKRTLHVASGKTEMEAFAKAKAWVDKRMAKPEKMLQYCSQCRDGQALERVDVGGRTYGFELHCGSCGVVLFRADTRPDWA